MAGRRKNGTLAHCLAPKLLTSPDQISYDDMQELKNEEDKQKKREIQIDESKL